MKIFYLNSGASLLLWTKKKKVLSKSSSTLKRKKKTLEKAFKQYSQYIHFKRVVTISLAITYIEYIVKVISRFIYIKRVAANTTHVYLSVNKWVKVGRNDA